MQVENGNRKPVKDVARYIQPMRPLRVPKLPSDNSKWLYEPKLDGYRAIALKNAGRPTLYSMDGQVYDRKFPKIFEALSKIIHKDFVLDGELVALEPNGRPNFNELQNHQHTNLPIFYIAFDILHFNKRDLLDQPLEERKQRLAEIAEAFVKPIQPILVFPEDLDNVRAARERMAKGIVLSHQLRPPRNNRIRRITTRVEIRVSTNPIRSAEALYIREHGQKRFDELLQRLFDQLFPD
jgi:ATP-dependent DNA ligase